jgi:hypothetical protein
MTKKRVMECFIGLTEESMKGSGRMENNMEKDFILLQVENREEASGQMEKELIG